MNRSYLVDHQATPSLQLMAGGSPLLLPARPSPHLTASPAGFSDRQLQAAYLAWCNDAAFEGIALTLTFKPAWQGQLLTRDIAESTVRHFLHRLNRKVGGRDQPPEARLRVIAVREGGIGIGNKRLHYHLKVESPTDWSPDDFCRLCLSVWGRLDWASTHQNRAVAKSDKHWISYILKLRDKADFATAIDISNSNLRSP